MARGTFAWWFVKCKSEGCRTGILLDVFGYRSSPSHYPAIRGCGAFDAGCPECTKTCSYDASDVDFIDRPPPHPGYRPYQPFVNALIQG